MALMVDERGIPGPDKRLKAMHARQTQGKKDWKKWLNAMPKPLKATWSNASGEFGRVNLAPLRSALEHDHTG